MTSSDPLLTSSTTVLWLKVLVTIGLLVVVVLRSRARGMPRAGHSLGVKVAIGLAVVFSFGLFHSFGQARSGQLVHYGEMFHYYLGSKYFPEVGYVGLYDAVIVADAEQDRALEGLPFYTDLTTYQNASRDTALRRADAVKARFSAPRWRAFKRDVRFFERATGMPRTAGIAFFVMDHGYNASPASSAVLGWLTNLVPVSELPLLALLDVVLVAALVALVFHTFGLATGGLFAVYFFVNILNDAGYISGGLLRYDWLFCLVAAVCLLERGRTAAAGALLSAAALLKVFPAVVLLGVAVTLVQRVVTSRSFDRASARFVAGAGVTALALFLLPAASLGAVLEPWQEFAQKTALHDRGVYVNHLGLRGALLFEPSHLSLERFAETFQHGASDDIVRNWQDAKEFQLEQERPLLAALALLALACVAACIWKRRAPERESVILPLLLVYVASYPSHYYYAFLCMFVLLFAQRSSVRAGAVPLGLLLLFNLAALVTDAFGPSPIVLYTLVNFYLLVCLTAMLGCELYDAFAKPPALSGAVAQPSARAKRKRKAS